jgi:HD-GYP domain-containing protein (c-di-GMP phosphodiesterase class II)
VKQKVKVRIEDLRVGMYVAELDKPWLETSFLFQGFVIGSDKDIRTLARTCEYVYVDTERSTTKIAEQKRQPSSMAHRASLRKPARTAGEQRLHKVPFEEEIGKVRSVHKAAGSHIQKMFEDARMGRTVDTGGAKKLVASLVGSIVRNPDALTWMTQLKHKDAYTAEHSLNVCILTLTFARHLGMDEATMKEIGLGGFMHDIGKLRVPLEILNKPGKLTEGEFELMKKHPTYGRDLLNRSGGVPSSTIDIAFAHHERAVGQGYPRGIQGQAISRFARIVAIVDVYDAISSDRIYHRGLSPQESMKRLYEWRNGSLDGELVEQFIQALGVYPLGSVVELNSGELAIVLSTDPKSRLQPKVLIATNAEKQLALPHHIIDLATETKRVGGGLAIRRVARPGDYDFDIGTIAKDHRLLSA